MVTWHHSWQRDGRIEYMILFNSKIFRILDLFVDFDFLFKLLTQALLKPEVSHPYLILVFSRKVFRSQTKIEWDLSLLLNRVQFMDRRNPRTSQSIETHISLSGERNICWKHFLDLGQDEIKNWNKVKIFTFFKELHEGDQRKDKISFNGNILYFTEPS